MALSMAKRRDEIPDDAVRLSEDEALEYQTKLISKWEPSYQV
jgi:hypothetical protein